MKTPEEIIRKYYQAHSYYVKEASEMRGIELYSIEMAVKAMKEFAEQEVAKVISSNPPVIKSVCLHEWDEGHQNVSKCKKCGKYSA